MKKIIISALLCTCLGWGAQTANAHPRDMGFIISAYLNGIACVADAAGRTIYAINSLGQVVNAQSQVVYVFNNHTGQICDPYGNVLYTVNSYGQVCDSGGVAVYAISNYAHYPSPWRWGPPPPPPLAPLLWPLWAGPYGGFPPLFGHPAWGHHGPKAKPGWGHGPKPNHGHWGSAWGNGWHSPPGHNKPRHGYGHGSGRPRH